MDNKKKESKHKACLPYEPPYIKRWRKEVLGTKAEPEDDATAAEEAESETENITEILEEIEDTPPVKKKKPKKESPDND